MDYPTRHCTPSISTSFSMCFFTLFVAPVQVSQYLYDHIDVSFHFTCSSASTCSVNMRTNRSADIHLARAKHFPASNMLRCKACVESQQRTAHISPVLHVKLPELEFVFGFLRYTRVSKGLGPD